MDGAVKQTERYTYGDYRRWPDDERWELIDGVAYAMPGPLRIHQEVVTALTAQISSYLKGKPCKVYVAPLDVRLPRQNEPDDDVDTTVQPDVIVVCDRRKLDDKGCRGAPDWIVEVLSPTTALYDMETKRKLYERYGVKEYWLVRPTERWVMIFAPSKSGIYAAPDVLGMTAPTAVRLFPDLSIDWTFMDEV